MTSRRAVLRGAAGGVAAALLAVDRARAEAAPPVATIEAFYDVLLDVMKQAAQLGFRGRYERLAPAIRRAFNLPLMTRLAIGPQWQNLPPQQQANLTDAFSRFSIATYASRFDDYSGERFAVDPTSLSASSGEIVNTRLVKPDGESVTLNYLMRQNDGGDWQIIDVFLSGTVSELTTRRSEFASVLRRLGPEALLQLLQTKASELQGS